MCVVTGLPYMLKAQYKWFVDPVNNTYTKNTNWAYFIKNIK